MTAESTFDGAAAAPARRTILLQLGTTLLLAGAAGGLYQARPRDVLPLASIEFASSPAGAVRMVTGQAGSVWRYAVCWVLTVLALAVLCNVGSRVLVTPRWQRLAGRLARALAAGAALTVVEALLLACYPDIWRPGPVWLMRTAQALAFGRNCLVAVALPVAVGVLGTAVVRLCRSAWRAGPPRWSAEQVVRGRRDGGPPPTRPIGGKGICVSGGGIRSACVTLGALQALQHEQQLDDTDYLVSVSGGGYIAGAYQLALTGETGAAATTATPADVFAPGSPEEDHVRRHGDYVAGSAAEWAAALGTVLRGVIANLGLLAATVAVAGGSVWLFYRFTHVIDVSELGPGFTVGADRAPDMPAVTQGVVTALVAGGLLTVLVFSIGLAAFARTGRGVLFVRAARVLAAGTAVLALFGLVLPVLLWASGRLTWTLGLHDRASLRSAGAGTVLFTYAGVLVGIVWRSRKSIASRFGSLRSRLSGSAQAGLRGVPGGLVQRIVVAAVLLLLGGAFLLQLGWTATTTARWSLWAWVFLLGALAFCAVVMDQTWLSLHPFYRHRLATAFAVRRVEKGGCGRAVPYDYEQELTKLSQYGAKRGRFPQVIFAATANLSGSALAPPGRRAVSYTLSHDWVGGPQVGWLATGTVDGEQFGQVSRDLTVQAAVAISGAAFASAMGAQSRAYQTFFALSNARLGAWLPNPDYVANYLGTAGETDWTVPTLRKMRRLQYLLREIFGSYPADNPLLYVTDGGHYDNLGLVELLRHRCRVICCVDASGDSPPLATTLARAITLAREELGVTITLHDPFGLVAGGGTELRPADPLSTLIGRLSATSVLRGEISYPERGEQPASAGTLVVAKAGLTAEMPYEVLSYAQSHPVFPNDSTADQWFDVGQFDAYQAVGWHIGLAAAGMLRDQPPPPPSCDCDPTPAGRQPAESRPTVHNGHP